MPVAIDTSILIAAEKADDLEAVLSGIEERIYVPAHAAAEFLVGTHPPVREDLRRRAQRLYEIHIRAWWTALMKATRLNWPR